MYFVGAVEEKGFYRDFIERHYAVLIWRMGLLS
jgi:hypothetical protein